MAVIAPLSIHISKAFLTDHERLPRGSPRGDQPAAEQGDPVLAGVRGGHPRLPALRGSADQPGLLRAGRGPHPQGRRHPQHLLRLQRLAGGAEGRAGGGHSG